jgi:hypothetical protein
LSPIGSKRRRFSTRRLYIKIFLACLTCAPIALRPDGSTQICVCVACSGVDKPTFTHLFGFCHAIGTFTNSTTVTYLALVAKYYKAARSGSRGSRVRKVNNANLGTSFAMYASEASCRLYSETGSSRTIPSKRLVLRCKDSGEAAAVTEVVVEVRNERLASCCGFEEAASCLRYNIAVTSPSRLCRSTLVSASDSNVRYLFLVGRRGIAVGQRRQLRAEDNCDREPPIS